MSGLRLKAAGVKRLMRIARAIERRSVKAINDAPISEVRSGVVAGDLPHHVIPSGHVEALRRTVEKVNRRSARKPLAAATPMHQMAQASIIRTDAAMGNAAINRLRGETTIGFRPAPAMPRYGKVDSAVPDAAPTARTEESPQSWLTRTPIGFQARAKRASCASKVAGKITDSFLARYRDVEPVVAGPAPRQGLLGALAFRERTRGVQEVFPSGNPFGGPMRTPTRYVTRSGRVLSAFGRAALR